MKPRVAYVECLGLPLKLWSTNTFQSIAKPFGELIGIFQQLDNELAFKNPVLKLATWQHENIDFRSVIKSEKNIFNISGLEVKPGVREWEFEDISMEEGKIANINQSSEDSQGGYG